MRVLLSSHYDNEDARRQADIYLVVDHYEVDFIEDGELVKSVVMRTNECYHSIHYAEDAAENWCTGIMQ